MTQAILVCGPRSFFGDDVAARCAGCDAAIVHRPSVPAEYVPLCLDCADALFCANEAAGEGPQTIDLLPDAAAEVLLYGETPKGRPS